VSQPAPVTTTASYPTESAPAGTGPVGTGPAGTGSGGGSGPSAYGNYTVTTYTPPATTYLSGTYVITSTLGSGAPSTFASPTKTPVGPTSVPSTVPTAAAAKFGPAGAILAAGLAVMAL
jgi:hypothetical protein